MRTTLKKTGRFLVRSALSLLAFGIILIALVQVILVFGINAFNTNAAHDFIQGKINEAAKPGGYVIAYDNSFYDPVRGFTLRGLVVSDAQGELLNLDTFSLDIAFSQIPLKQLSVSGSMGTLNLVRLPASTEETPKEDTAAFTPFQAPDIFFNIINIDHFSINTLSLSETIAGTPMIFSPSLQARIGMGEAITTNITLKPGAQQKLGNVSLPDSIILQSDFTPSSLSLALENFEISSGDYTVTAKGNGQFTETGMLDLTLNAAYHDLKPLTQNQMESASIDASIKGPYHDPALKLDGILVPALLKERGVTDIAVNAAMENVVGAMKGTLAIATTYKEQPVTIESALAYIAPALTIESLKGTAPEIILNGNGILATDSMLFDGALDLAANDLSYYKELLATNLAGTLTAKASLKPKDGVQSLTIDAAAKNIALDATKVRSIDITASLSDIASPWPQAAKADIMDLVLAPKLSLKKATASVTQGDGEGYKLSLNGNGNFPAAFSFNGGADLSDLTNKIPTTHNISLDAKLGQSSVRLAGSFTPDAVNLNVTTKNFRGQDIPATLPEALSNLRINGDVTVNGAPSAPVTKAGITATGLSTGQYKGLVLALDATHENGAATAILSGKGTGIRTLSADAAFLLQFALMPFAFEMDQGAVLSGKLLADLEMAQIAALFLPPTQSFGGALKADGALGGTLSAPDVSGNIILRGGSFLDEANGIAFAAMNADASFTKEALHLKSLTATDGETGTLDGRGTISFDSTNSADITLSARNFHLPKSDLADGLLDANFSLKSASAGMAATGTVDIERMNILVPETFQSKIPELNIVERKNQTSASPARGISLGIKINAPNQVFVRGWGLDAEFGGDIEISGFADAPQFNGALSSKRGRYEEFGKRFTLARGDLRFQGEIPPSPYLDIEATTKAGDTTASVLLTGSVKSPKIGFSSTPPLPEDEVLSLILFGKGTATITPFQAVQLAQTVQRFSGKGGGGFDPLGLIRSATGIDDISIDTDEAGETNVGVGKYLTDDVYLEFEKGKAENSGAANIQIEVTPNVNIESKIGQDAQGGGGIFWKRDY